jgi:hypothetical protein
VCGAPHAVAHGIANAVANGQSDIGPDPKSDAGTFTRTHPAAPER